MLNAALRPEIRTAVVIIAGLTLWRWLALALDPTDLWVDEAQYWLWGQHLDWGYFSKPPMIAFWLRGITDLAGSDSTFWIRAGGPLMHAATALLIGLSGARLYDARVGAWAALLYATAPFVTLGSWLFSTDTVMLPFFAVALYAWIRMTEARSVVWAIVCGVGIGCGFLSKYAVIYLPLSLALAVLLIPRARIAWRDAAIAAALAIAVAVPNILWNLANDGTTVRHIAEDNARVGQSGIDFAQASEFILSQFAVFGPVLFAALFLAFAQLIRGKAKHPMPFLGILSFTVLLLLSVQAARAGANANWAVTAYVAGAMLVAAQLSSWPRTLMLGFSFNLAIALLFPLAVIFAETIRLPNGKLLAARYLGPRDLSLAIAEHAEQSDLTIIVAERRGVLADLFYTLRDTTFSIHAPPFEGRPHNYYEQTFALPEDTVEDILFVTQNASPCSDASTIAEYKAETGIYRGLTFKLFQTPPRCLRSKP